MRNKCHNFMPWRDRCRVQILHFLHLLSAEAGQLLVEGVQSGNVQEAMKQAADGVSKAASGAASAASSAAASASAAAGSAVNTKQQQPKQPTWKRASPQQQQQRAKEQQAGGQQQPSDLDAYFTTDVMGVELGEGATAWSGATVAILEAGAPVNCLNEAGRTPLEEAKAELQLLSEENAPQTAVRRSRLESTVEMMEIAVVGYM